MSDTKATDMKLNRVRVRVATKQRPGRYLFGWRVNEYGFLSDGGRVMAITPQMEVEQA